MKIEHIDRFWKSVNKTGGCWEWTGSKSPHGYGSFSADNKKWQAHRWIYHYLHGGIPDGLYICHACDNPSCVRPDHLFAGTQLDNIRDAVKKGRNKYPTREFMHTIRGMAKENRGEKHGMHKLTEDAVRDIRSSSLSGADLGRIYHVSTSVICMVRRNEIWKHVR